MMSPAAPATTPGGATARGPVHLRHAGEGLSPGRFCYHRDVPIENPRSSEAPLVTGTPPSALGHTPQTEEPSLRLIDRMRQHLRPRPKRVLSPEQLAEWSRDGFLVLERLMPESLLQAYEREVAATWAGDTPFSDRIVVDMLTGAQRGQRLRLRDALPGSEGLAHKLNDLYLESPATRDLLLGEPLAPVLADLLAGMPMVCNSLSFVRGSQQALHFDTYYMPPPQQDMMVVASVCLEDWHPDAGPLQYCPGSHKIPPYRFSHGGLHAVPEEMEDATRYIHQALAERGIETREFIGRRGDVFIWHGQLYHGGAPIKDFDRTRRSIVAHFWRVEDTARSKIERWGHHAAYLSRDHQPVPAA